MISSKSLMLVSTSGASYQRSKTAISQSPYGCGDSPRGGGSAQLAYGSRKSIAGDPKPKRLWYVSIGSFRGSTTESTPANRCRYLGSRSRGKAVTTLA